MPAHADGPFYELTENFELKPRCERFYAALGIDSPLVARRVLNPEQISSDGKFPLHSQAGYDPNAITIGIANNPNRGIHHYYLVAGKRRLEGDELFRNLKIMKGAMGSSGVGFEIQLPPGVAAVLEARMNNGQARRGLSCLHTVCKLLEQEGIEIVGAEKGKPIRTKVVAASLMQGKIKLHGQHLDPEAVRMFESHEGELVHYMEQALVADAKVARAIKEKALIGGGLLFVLLPGSIGAFIYTSAKEKRDYKPVHPRLND